MNKIQMMKRKKQNALLALERARYREITWRTAARASRMGFTQRQIGLILRCSRARAHQWVSYGERWTMRRSSMQWPYLGARKAIEKTILLIAELERYGRVGIEAVDKIK